jgi:hypothetical protein
MREAADEMSLQPSFARTAGDGSSSAEHVSEAASLDLIVHLPIVAPRPPRRAERVSGRFCSASATAIVQRVSVAGVYCRDVSRQMRYLATWPAGAPLAVGRVGRFYGEKVFDPETSLGSFGIEFTVGDDPGGQGLLSWASDGVNVSELALGAKVPDLYTRAA